MSASHGPVGPHTTPGRKVLVTGAGGQVGLDLLQALRARGDQVFASDLAPPSGDAGPGLPWSSLDVTRADQVDALVAELRPDVVYHLAAILSATGERDPLRTYAVNQDGTLHVLEAARKFSVRQVIFTSTIAVFGPGLPPLVGDDVSLRPTTMYGVTKVAGELLGEYYSRRHGLDFRGVRFPGLLSAVLPGGGTSDYAPLMYYESLRTGGYEAFCRPDSQIPLMYMPDALRALVELSLAPRERLGRCIYNIAAFSPTAHEIADEVARVVPGARITFKPDPARQAILDSWPRALDDTCARRDWDWRPAWDLARMSDDLTPKLAALAARAGK
ncbi:NAD-dependent epimerase/dehydratase family protein [Nannocystis sp. ILAH1]|uniref:NAD-dependent epimerase/dehydratase family protein n=1 Tax=unclassified Nannocystis TaxID=2627009 RepID=UPI00226D71D5|nr:MULTISPECIES: NAD-dependent epimerase/dehydratase family protein [unclassified Nannocystis]MCY0991887.1 NAD-dependent epimerase/dehydratase family protein [Nannocystis sp. ILAH1]MCY1064138.1 NAD-dependent epimerase/dehydratase family protein [Nannocystis sp. RBIL2]